MEPPARPADRQAIARLGDDFCHELDRGTVEGFAALFMPDALYTHGARALRGIEQIREFYSGRTRDGPRTSRHMVTGLRVDFTGETAARGLSVCMTFSAPGLPRSPRRCRPSLRTSRISTPSTVSAGASPNDTYTRCFGLRRLDE